MYSIIYICFFFFFKHNMAYHVYLLLFFFFSSRRRHTRWNCDWSSDVCSSDLGLVRLLSRNGIDFTRRFRALAAAIALLLASTLLLDGEVTAFDEHLLSYRARSEERRVGKECRALWSAAQ